MLLGAAGVQTVAVGFAAQTSASNIISGLFLLVDKPFQVGDVVRIPNEEVNKSQVKNVTYWPLRRIDIDVGVAYKEETENVKDALMSVADRNPLCLEEPTPLFICKGYGDSALEFLFCVWTAKQNYLQVMNGIKQQIKEEFDHRGIEIPFPHLSIYTGSVTKPFPVELTQRG